MGGRPPCARSTPRRAPSPIRTAAPRTSVAVTRSPTKNTARATATRNGSHVGLGHRLAAFHEAVEPGRHGHRVVEGAVDAVASAAAGPDGWPTGSSSWSHSGWRLATIGMAAKLYSGGGDEVAHSSESAFHGFGPGDLAVAAAPEEVDKRQAGADAEHDGADAHDQVQRAPTQPVVVGPDPPGHAHETEDVHREERDVEADEHRPEAPLAETLVQHAAGHLRAASSRGRRRSGRRRRRSARSGSAPR